MLPSNPHNVAAALVERLGSSNYNGLAESLQTLRSEEDVLACAFFIGARCGQYPVEDPILSLKTLNDDLQRVVASSWMERVTPVNASMKSDAESHPFFAAAEAVVPPTPPPTTSFPPIPVAPPTSTGSSENVFASQGFSASVGSSAASQSLNNDSIGGFRTSPFSSNVSSRRGSRDGDDEVDGKTLEEEAERATLNIKGPPLFPPVEVKSGEEDEEIGWKGQVRLYRKREDEWVERAIKAELKVLYQPQEPTEGLAASPRTGRIVVRENGTRKIRANHTIPIGLAISDADTSAIPLSIGEVAWGWKAVNDTSYEPPQDVQLLAVFPNGTVPSEAFRAAVAKCGALLEPPSQGQETTSPLIES